MSRLGSLWAVRDQPEVRTILGDGLLCIVIACPHGRVETVLTLREIGKATAEAVKRVEDVHRWRYGCDCEIAVFA